METNSQLKGLFTDTIGQNESALLLALENGLVKVADLSEANPKHRTALIALGCKRFKAPERFIKTATPAELTTLLGSSLNQVAAQAEVDTRVARKDVGILNHIIDDGMYRKTEGWPDNIQKLVAPILSDPAQTTDDRWERVRRNMTAEHQEEVSKVRSVTKRRATVAAIAAGTKERVKHSDPLLEAIANDDVKRMRGLSLDTLKPDRWEKAKTDWLLSTDVGVRAHLTKLPVDYLTPEIMATGLEAAAKAKLSNWELPLPKWPIPKAVLKTLTPAAVAHWLKVAASDRVSFDAPLTGAELTEELSPMLVMEALQDPEVGRVMEWLAGLRRARKVMKYRGAKSSPTAEEGKMLETVQVGIHRVYGNEGPVEAFTSSDTPVLTIIRWLLGMDDAELARLGGAILSMSEVADSIPLIFGKDLSTNFAEDI